MKTLFFFALAFFLIFITACKDTADPNPIYKGAEQVFGNGKVYSWVKFNGDKPSSIGITFTNGALDNLSHLGTALTLALPNEAIGKTPFDHVMLDYLHTGHEPSGVYDVAHFDVHFYMQASAERKAIPPYPVAPVKFDNLPPAGYMSTAYIRLPAGVPEMGVHWADPTSQELTGKGKFTETLVEGSYDGKFTFIEPMIAYEYLKTKPSFTKVVPLPTKFIKSGYYPMKYSIKQDGNDTLISLDEMMLMQ